ncbi:hypothetical protein JCM3766R1_002942 [Sporobolomyces carnicolor]
MIPSFVAPVVFSTILEAAGLDKLPALELAISLDFDFKARGCLADHHSPTPSASLLSLVDLFTPRTTVHTRIETRRGLKSKISDLESISKLASESSPTVVAASGAFARLCQIMCDGIDLLYTPAVLAAHLARAAATLELPDGMCSLMLSIGSAMPACGHRECIIKHKKSAFYVALKCLSMQQYGEDLLDDKITISLDAELLNCLVNPVHAIRALIPLFSTLIRSLAFRPIAQLPVTFKTHCLPRKPASTPLASPALSASTTPRITREKANCAPRRILKRKASSRVLTDVGSNTFASFGVPTSHRTANESAVAALQRISKRTKVATC